MMSSRPDGRPGREDQVPGQDYESEQQHSGGAAATNVVPLPRPWYGSPDELVPICTALPQADRERDQPPAAPAHAEDFWGGDGAVLEPAGGPAGGPAGTAEPEGSDRRVQTPLPAWAAPARRPRQLETVLLAVVALAAGAAAAIVLGPGLAPSRSGRVHVTHTRQRTVTQTIPVRELVVRTVASSSGAGRPARPAQTRSARSGTHGAQTPRKASYGAPVRTGSSDRAAATTATPAAAISQGATGSTAVQAATVAAPPREAPGCAPSVTNGGACSL
jgi:hypothetical protein